MRISHILTAILVSLVTLPASAAPDPVAPAGESKTSALDAKLQARFRHLAKGVDGINAEFKALKKAKGAARASKIAKLETSMLTLRADAKRLKALGQKAKVHPKTIAAIRALERHVGSVASLAGEGLKSSKAMASAGGLVRQVLKDKREIAGLVEPIVFR